MVAIIIIAFVMGGGVGTTGMVAAIIALEGVAVMDSIIMILLILSPVMEVVPGDMARAAGIMALEIVAVLDTVAMVAAIFAHHAGIDSSDIYLYDFNKSVSGL